MDANGAIYTFDVDSLESKLDYAQAILEKMVNSLTFFDPYVAPSSAATSTPAS